MSTLYREEREVQVVHVLFAVDFVQNEVLVNVVVVAVAVVELHELLVLVALL